MPAQPDWFHRLDEILAHPIAKYFRGFNQVVQPDEGCARQPSGVLIYFVERAGLPKAWKLPVSMWCWELMSIRRANFFRYKSVFGGDLKARHSKAQRREAAIGCHILNRMAELGRASSYALGR